MSMVVVAFSLLLFLEEIMTADETKPPHSFYQQSEYVRTYYCCKNDDDVKTTQSLRILYYTQYSISINLLSLLCVM
jgi:hypothetical protein